MLFLSLPPLSLYNFLFFISHVFNTLKLWIVLCIIIRLHNESFLMEIIIFLRIYKYISIKLNIFEKV